MKNLSSKALLLCTVIALNACKKDARPGNGTTTPGEDNFLVVTNINSGATPAAYVGTMKDFSIGSYNNTRARQTTVYPSVVTYNGDVFVLQRGSGDIITKYTRNANGSLDAAGTAVMPPASAPYWMVFESSTKAYVSLTAAGKIAVLNPSTMEVSGYIDLTAYAIGDASPDPNVMAFRNGKLYVACAQSSDSYTSSNPAQVLIVDVANGNTITSVTDRRTTYAANSDAPGSIFFTENGDLYVYCVASWGYAGPSQKAGFLRIKSGETVFDPAYFFNTSDYVIAGISGSHADYLQHPAYAGNGIVYSTGDVPALSSNPPDYIHDRTFGAFKVDVINQSITQLGIPYSNGYAACVMPYQGKVYYGMSTSTGVGFYEYDPASNTAGTSPVVSTQGDPSLIVPFK
ncbi:MAG TPA: hypothetical protein VGC22_01745 [Chitinophaga sp.]